MIEIDSVGYAVSNCSTDGRAMMGIDLQNVIQVIESISELKVNLQLLKLTEVFITSSAYINEFLELHQSVLPAR